ncbi:DNA/RNA endonuclease G [Microbacterium sp. NPDC089189]|uniref:DUF6286 domain-containing protein n=1 Tax=Microbacterium sp. NPDC089189 TaxID=3154972 RepID=UPI003434B083
MNAVATSAPPRDRVLRRVVRRETHSPRTVAAVTVAILVIVALAYLGVELVLAMTSSAPLLVAPLDLLAGAATLPESGIPAAVVAIAALVAVIGVALIVVALSPGRLAKHEMPGEDAPVLVDNAVIAGALAHTISTELGLERSRVRVGVSHRTADITVRPVAGIPLPASDVRESAERALEEYGTAPSLRVVVRIARTEGDRS